MINLRIDDYCEDCPCFVVAVNKFYADERTCTDIYCENSATCKIICNHLKRKLEEEYNEQKNI